MSSRHAAAASTAAGVWLLAAHAAAMAALLYGLSLCIVLNSWDLMPVGSTRPDYSALPVGWRVVAEGASLIYNYPASLLVLPACLYLVKPNERSGRLRATWVAVGIVFACLLVLGLQNYATLTYRR